jgi:cyclophilin family peptidyl-prolyl cis-trans isomerase
VARFLATLDGDGNVYPSFYNCQFTKIVNESLLEMERVRGINRVDIAGSESYEYQGNILTDYQPILENSNVSHNKRGLLTRRQLVSGPEFGITLSPAPELDQFHIAFGEVVEGLDVLEAIGRIPTYSYKTATGYAGKERGVESGLVDAWFEGQRKLFVGVGKSMGDTRAADQRGRLLRRVLIKKAGRISSISGSA